MRNLLPQLRAERRLTQAGLAELLGVSRQTVISIEKGKYDPSLPLAFDIAAVFGRPIETIFFPDQATATSDVNRLAAAGASRRRRPSPARRRR